VRTDSGAHPALYLKWHWGMYLLGKSAEAWIWPHFHLAPSGVELQLHPTTRLYDAHKYNSTLLRVWRLVGKCSFASMITRNIKLERGKDTFSVASWTKG
jgi:hypothetical protein